MREKALPLESRESKREKLVRALTVMREKGVRDQVALRLLEDWTKQEEATVPNTHEGSILFNLKRARLYRDAGYFEEAAENYLAALEQAGHENNRGLTSLIEKELGRLPPS